MASNGNSSFELGESTEWIPSSPQELFGELSISDSDVEHLWTHQDAVLDAYIDQHENAEDVAIELPTGMGKTLVGFLLADYRRRAHTDRVAYLCPTKQLAQQAVDHAHRYGIDARLLIGPQDEYPPSDYAAYRRGQAVAVTTYAGIFNSNPRINNAQCLILDDAHSGSDFISRMWSVQIPREHSCYRDIVEIYSDSIPYPHLSLVRDPNADPYRRQNIYKVPSPAFYRRANTLLDYCDENLDGRPSYPWSLIRQQLEAVHLFISWHEVLLRPLIPPTERHSAVADAEQRVYMSATLGEGGELERSTGVSQIERIPVPEGWESQRTGRRFPTLPDYSLSKQEAREYVVRAIEQRERSLILCPTWWLADRIQAVIETETDLEILGATEVENSLNPFIERSGSVLLLAGRYDGIDLPDASCRQIIVAGLPKALDPQEQFFFDNLRTHQVLRDRVRTRLVQGMGRCTRNRNDYAAVILWGPDLLDFCLQRENRVGMPAELQAELDFGIQNSDVDSASQLLERLEIFFNQGDDWSEADSRVRESRREKQKESDPFSETLGEVAELEVEHAYALWDGAYERALDRAREIADQLSGDELANYRGWWHYLSASAAFLVEGEGLGEDAGAVYRNQMRRAEAAAEVSWLRSLPRILDQSQTGSDSADTLTTAAAENVAEQLRDFGFAGPKFEQSTARFLQLLGSDDADPFEQGLLELGQLLGFDAHHPDDDAMPDSVWTLDGRVGIAVEAKSQIEARPDRGISVSTARQCSGHRQTLDDWNGLINDATRIVVLVNPLDAIEEEARRFIDDTYWISVSEIRDLAERVVEAIRRVRTRSESSSELVGDLVDEYQREGLDPSAIERWLTETLARDLPSTGN